MRLSIPFHLGLEGILLSKGLEVGWKGKAERRNEAANKTQHNKTKTQKSRKGAVGLFCRFTGGTNAKLRSSICIVFLDLILTKVRQ